MSSDPAVNNTMEVDATIDGTTATTVATAERQIIDAIFETETSVPRLAHANSIAFEELLVFMRGAELVARFKAFFELLYRTTSPLGGQEELPPTPINWRIVLAAYLVAVRPTHVFQSTGETERILLHASSVLVRTFEAIYDTLATSHSRSLQDLPAQLVASFHDQLRAFLVAYDAWQIPDMEKLKMRLRNALIIIYRAYNAVESEDEETAQRAASMAALQEQMALLEAKLKKFCRDEEDGAAAVQALRDAVRDERGEVGVNAIFKDDGRASNEHIVHFMMLWSMPLRMALEGPSGSRKEGLIIEPSDLIFDDQVDVGYYFRRVVSLCDLFLTQSVYETMKTQMVELGRFDECLSVFANLVRKIRQVDPTHQINDFVCITDMQKAAADGTLGTEAVIKALLDVVVVIKPLHKNGNERSFHEAWDVLHRELESDEFEETDGPAWISKALEFFSRQIRMLCVESGNKRYALLFSWLYAPMRYVVSHLSICRLADLFPVLVEHGLKYEQDKFEKKFPAGSVLSNTKVCITTTTQLMHFQQSNLTNLFHRSGCRASWPATMRRGSTRRSRCRPSRPAISTSSSLPRPCSITYPVMRHRFRRSCRSMPCSSSGCARNWITWSGVLRCSRSSGIICRPAALRRNRV